MLRLRFPSCSTQRPFFQLSLVCSSSSKSSSSLRQYSSSPSSTSSNYSDQNTNSSNSGGNEYDDRYDDTNDYSSSFGTSPASSGSGGEHRFNPADFASSGIHGPAATVARREFGDSAGKWRADFHSERMMRCTLCEESINNWAGHVVFVSHQARLGIIERVLAGSCGPPEKVVERWWKLLNIDPEGAPLHRIKELSAEFSEERRRRLIYLLRFLQGNGILKVALGVYNDETREFGRSNVFERFEMVGDNVVKAVFFDRLQSLFPVSDGGATGKMTMIQQLIDSNEGLLQSFDFLELDKIIGIPLSQSKFKSDVMEALFGELQTYLWAVPQLWDSPTEYNAINAAAGPEMVYVEALVRHTLLELTDVMLMFAVESTVTRAEKLLKREYRGSPNPKPLPNERFSQNFGANNAAMLKSRGSSKSGKLKQMKMEDIFVSHSNYDCRPFISFEPYPKSAFDESSSSSNDSQQTSTSTTNYENYHDNNNSSNSSSSSSSHNNKIGVSVLKPLAVRLAEATERKRLKEASWKLEAHPLLTKFLLEDAELSFIDFTEQCLDGAPTGSLQKRVKMQHVDDFVDENEIQDENINNINNNNNFYSLSETPITTSTIKNKNTFIISSPSSSSSSSWWRKQSVSCPWSPLLPLVQTSKTVSVEPPLTAISSFDNYQQEEEQDGKEEIRNEEKEISTPVIHVVSTCAAKSLYESCSTEALLDFSFVKKNCEEEEEREETYDFTLEQLRPLVGILNFSEMVEDSSQSYGYSSSESNTENKMMKLSDEKMKKIEK